MKQISSSGLVRAIRKWDTVALVINVIIGAGIFGLPSRIYQLAGGYSLLAYLVCALLVVLIILCFAEISSRFTETGGPYLYAREAFGPAVGFEVGWLMWLARLTAFAALCNLFIGYLSYFWPPASSALWRAIIITVIVASLTLVNVVGVREAALVSNIFTVGKLIPLLFFIIAGSFFVDFQRFSSGPQLNYSSFSTAVLLLVFAFSGFEMVVIPAGEALDPRRHIPFALLTGISVVALIYISIQVVCIGTLPELASSERPLADASSRVMGAVGASIISAGALISITGTLNAIMLTGPRVLFAMAEQGQLPRALSRTHRRFHTPYVAVLVSAAIMLWLTLSGTFIYALTISTIIRLITYAATCIALPVMRRRSGAQPAMFSAPAGTAISIAALALCGWLLSSSAWSEAGIVAVAAILGLFIYGAHHLMKRIFRPVPAATEIQR